MKNKLLLMAGLLLIPSIIVANKDEVFAPYDPTNNLQQTAYKMFLNVTLNLLNRIFQAPVEVVVPVVTHEIAYVLDAHIIKRAEHKESVLKIESQQNELETQKKLNEIKIETAQDKLAQLKIDMALQSQKAKIASIEKDNSLSEEERVEKIKIEKARLEQMQTKFTEHLSGKAVEGSSSVKENPAILPNLKKQEQNLPTQPENTTISTPTSEVNQTPAPNPTSNNEQPTAPVQTEIPVASPTAAV